MTHLASRQRSFSDVVVGEDLPSVEFPLTVYRLVVAAGGNRDFNSIHHNTAYAQATGAPEMYASTFFLMGMWERLVRDYIGPAGTILDRDASRARTALSSCSSGISRRTTS